MPLVFLHATLLIGNHLVGGYLHYTHVSDTTININLIVYRDCGSATLFDGSTGTTAKAILGVFDSHNNLIDTINLGEPAILPLYMPVDSSCQGLALPCVEKGIYSVYYNLPSDTETYTLVYQRCCFSPNFTNILYPDNRGQSFIAFVLPLSVFPNSNPLVTGMPVLFTEVNKPFNYKNWCTDPDADSLRFAFKMGLAGGSPADPIPIPPTSPPYSPMVWQSGFSESNVLGSAPITIDSATGEINAMPNMVGWYLITVMVSEYRGGILFNNNLVSFWLAVAACNNVDIKEESLQTITLWPNPVKSHCEISLPAYNHQYHLFNGQGSIIKSGSCIEQLHLDDLNVLPAGIYFIRFQNDKGMPKILKFIKE